MGFDDFKGVSPEPVTPPPTVIPDDDASELEAGRKLRGNASIPKQQPRIPVMEEDNDFENVSARATTETPEKGRREQTAIEETFNKAIDWREK
jgi:hypothetical protein